MTESLAASAAFLRWLGRRPRKAPGGIRTPAALFAHQIGAASDER